VKKNPMDISHSKVHTLFETINISSNI